MKTLIIPAIFLILIICGGIIEQVNLNKNFDTLLLKLEDVSQKIEDETAKEEDMTEISKWWNDLKTIMHTYLPHSEIKEIDFWLSETGSYIATGNFDHARAKIKTLITIAKAIPKSFQLNLENIC